MESREEAWNMRKQDERGLEVQWAEKREVLTLEDQPVLEYELVTPVFAGKGIGIQRLRRFYGKTAQCWEERWRKKLYILACADWAEKSEQGKHFIPWCCQLKGEETWQDDKLLCIRMEAEEVRGDGRKCIHRWGDLWVPKSGTPYPMRELFGEERNWKKAVLTEIIRQGEQRRACGDCFLDQNWTERAAKLLPAISPWRTEDGVVYCFPQAAVAPAVEGTPTFVVPIHKTEPVQTQEGARM